jgi:hypothetical protein
MNDIWFGYIDYPEFNPDDYLTFDLKANVLSGFSRRT